MDIEEFKEGIQYLFHPEPDDDGTMLREFPNRRLRETLGFNFKYMETSEWEGSSVHKHTRLCPEDEERIHVLTRNRDVPERLFLTSLRLFADSVIEYHNVEDRKGDIRYYPPIVLTFWSGFETFVRYSSELLIITAFDLSDEVVRYLCEEEKFLTKKGDIRQKAKYQTVLDRYAVFLRYAYNYEVDRGSQFWQGLEQAKNLRDYYTHLNVSDPRALTSGEVLSYLEAILLAIIAPSSHLQRTIMLGVYWLYEIWSFLHENSIEYTERPVFFDWHLKEGYLFHCNFKNVDRGRFPSKREEYERKRTGSHRKY